MVSQAAAASGGTANFADVLLEEQIKSILASLPFAGLEFAVLGRVTVRVLLAEWNKILARNITIWINVGSALIYLNIFERGSPTH